VRTASSRPIYELIENDIWNVGSAWGELATQERIDLARLRIEMLCQDFAL
jgi:hypothetical protein